MSVFRRMAVVAVVLSGLLLGAAVPSNADHYHGYRCKHRIYRAEYNLRKAIRRHGPDSAQAEYRRHQLEEVREACHYRHERYEERREERLEHEDHEMHEHDYDHDHDHDHDD